MSGISFNTIPGSGLVGPIFAFEVNSGGQFTESSRLVLFGHKTAAGIATANVPYPISSQGDADTYFGGGSMLREMFRIARQNAPVQDIWAVAVPDTGTAPVTTVTLANIANSTAPCVIEIQGEQISVTATASDTPSTIAADLAALINAYYNPLTNAMLPVTASASAGVVTLTGRHASAIMGEIDIYFPSLKGTNLLAQSGVATVAVTTAASGAPSLAAAFAALGSDPADFVVSPWTDSASLATGTTWANDTSGRWSWFSQTYGHVWTCNSGNYAAQTTLGLGLNDRHETVIGRITGGANGQAHPSWLWAAGICGAVCSWLSDFTTGNVSRNQTGIIVQGLKPPRDRTVWPQYAARNSLLQSGISTWTVDAAHNVCIDKIVTTYRTGASGQPDSVFRDIQSVYQAQWSLQYIRAQIAQDCGQKAFAQTNPGSLGSIVTPADIKASFIHAVTQLEKNGVLTNSSATAQLIQVQQDTTNPDRVNVFLPLERVSPLDVLATNATFYSLLAA